MEYELRLGQQERGTVKARRKSYCTVCMLAPARIWCAAIYNCGDRSSSSHELKFSEQKSQPRPNLLKGRMQRYSAALRSQTPGCPVHRACDRLAKDSQSILHWSAVAEWQHPGKRQLVVAILAQNWYMLATLAHSRKANDRRGIDRKVDWPSLVWIPASHRWSNMSQDSATATRI